MVKGAHITNNHVFLFTCRDFCFYNDIMEVTRDCIKKSQQALWISKKPGYCWYAAVEFIAWSYKIKLHSHLLCFGCRYLKTSVNATTAEGEVRKHIVLWFKETNLLKWTPSYNDFYWGNLERWGFYRDKNRVKARRPLMRTPGTETGLASARSLVVPVFEA